MKKDPRHAPYTVFDAVSQAEPIYMCWDAADVKRAILELVNDYDCDEQDIFVLPTSAAIPFTFRKVEAVEIYL
jgi:hypothetical protein